jgi:hypothetical protein
MCSYINVYNGVGVLSLVLMLYIFMAAAILQVSKKELDNTLQAAQRDAEAGVYTYEVFDDVQNIMQQSRSINMLLSIDLLLMMVQLYKYFRFNRRLAMLSHALIQ